VNDVIRCTFWQALSSLNVHALLDFRKWYSEQSRVAHSVFSCALPPDRTFSPNSAIAPICSILANQNKQKTCGFAITANENHQTAFGFVVAVDRIAA
jgi:hypothetical protein